MPPPTPRERLSGLDLLRAVAIILVLWWHLGPALALPWRPATWAGVDLFFVLSGYLIGSQLLKPYASGARPAYGDFFLRRFLRVVPAYTAVLLLYFCVPQFREAPGISPWWKFATFTQNLGLNARSYGAFSHAWSLCVEEHFYLILPLIVYWLLCKPSLAKAVWFGAGIVGFGMVLRAVLWIRLIQPLVEQHIGVSTPFLTYIYYPTYNRLDGLLVGVLLATTKLFRPKAWARLTVFGNGWLIAGLIVLSGAFWICQDMFAFTTAVVGYPLLGLGFGMLVLSALSPGSLLAKHRVPGATAIATLAYSTYLTHKEIMRLDRVYLAPHWQWKGPLALAAYFLTFAVAAAVLYFTVERPFLKLRDRWLGPKLKARSAEIMSPGSL